VTPVAVVIDPPGIGARWSAARRFAGYGAASTMSLYLLVKVIWIIGTLLGDGPKDNDWGSADFVMLNTLTVGMAAIGVALGLALAQPWGRRIPTPPLVFVAWVGAGFLMPLLPFMVVSSVIGAAGVGTGGANDDTSGGADAMPAWETVFMSIGIAGMALGLAVALPIYMRERWPHAFLGRLGDGPPAVGSARAPGNGFAVRAALVVSSGLGLLWLFWAIGGTLGLDPAQRDLLDLNARLLTGSWGAWALIGAWSIWVITRQSAARLPLWIPTTLAFAASGSLFAWSSWKLPMAVWRPGDYVTPEYPVVAVIQHAMSISAGIAILTGLLRAHRAIRDSRGNLPRPTGRG
jgi:hypothetical protein